MSVNLLAFFLSLVLGDRDAVCMDPCLFSDLQLSAFEIGNKQ